MSRHIGVQLGPGPVTGDEDRCASQMIGSGCASRRPAECLGKKKKTTCRLLLSELRPLFLPWKKTHTHTRAEGQRSAISHFVSMCRCRTAAMQMKAITGNLSGRRRVTQGREKMQLGPLHRLPCPPPGPAAESALSGYCWKSSTNT